MKVAFLDLAAQYKSIKKEILAEVTKVCNSQYYVLGPKGKELEAGLAGLTNAKYASGCASGTDAILLSLMALGVGRGDKVVTTPYTFFSTASSITRLGAVPVFVDIEPDTYNINPLLIEKALKKSSKKVKAIIPVHLYGQSADMGAIKKLAAQYGIKVVEDACQAIGATYKSKPVGSIGDLGAFSFYPSKNLGGAGDGGMVTTNNKRLHGLVDMLRVHGCKDRYHHRLVGINSRLDELQAAVLNVKLKRIEEWTEGRIKNAARYDDLFKKAGLVEKVATPFRVEASRHVYNQYVIRVKRREPLRKFLLSKEIGCGVYYPIPLHLQVCFAHLGYKLGDMPVSERAALETLALPIYPELSLAKQRFVVSMIKEFYDGK